MNRRSCHPKGAEGAQRACGAPVADMKIGASRIHQGQILLLGRLTRSDRQREATDLVVIAGAKGSGDSRLEWVSGCADSSLAGRFKLNFPSCTLLLGARRLRVPKFFSTRLETDLPPPRWFFAGAL